MSKRELRAISDGRFLGNAWAVSDMDGILGGWWRERRSYNGTLPRSTQHWRFHYRRGRLDHWGRRGAYGMVALVSAYVDVFGTAPGMFATQ